MYLFPVAVFEQLLLIDRTKWNILTTTTSSPNATTYSSAKTSSSTSTSPSPPPRGEILSLVNKRLCRAPIMYNSVTGVTGKGCEQNEDTTSAEKNITKKIDLKTWEEWKHVVENEFNLSVDESSWGTKVVKQKLFGGIDIELVDEELD
ncbi:unnamed protein product [Amoebophrya sp. A25]|nr:unnamed protein product [Amoebophrya sp. A25]|eukprot:GSA25T00000799001.1